MALTVGSTLGAYEILGTLGAGGMGEVYRARDTRLDRVVAIKILRDDVAGDPSRRARFEREARLISQLHHPHICTLYDVGRHGNTDYLVLEFLAGARLADRLARSGDRARLLAKDPALPVQEALTIAIQIADALESAHRRGIVHRDLKPANVMLTPTGVKLLDFGIAKAIGRDASDTDETDVAGVALEPDPREARPPATADTLTLDGALLGTVHYMAPEQLEGRSADARSDLFAFGAVLYELLTGRRAFDGESQSAVIAAVLDSDPPPTARRHPLLEHIVARCLAKDPQERWQTATDLKRELGWIRDAALTEATRIALPRRRVVAILA